MIKPIYPIDEFAVKEKEKERKKKTKQRIGGMHVGFRGEK
jgi:hypothetical protein